MLPLALAAALRRVPAAAPGLGARHLQRVTGLAVLAGPVVGGAVAQGMAWQWIFWLNVPIGLVMIPLILTRIPASRPSLAPASTRSA